MRNILIFVLLKLLVSFSTFSQDNSSRLSMKYRCGIIFDDGFTYRQSLPVVGLGLGYEISKYFSFDVDLTSIYKTEYDISSPPNIMAFNILLRDTDNMFISQDDRDKITNVGIKDLASIKNVKYLYLPLTISLSSTPIRYKKNSFGFGLGISAIYGSYKATRDFSPIDITLNDGTVLRDLPFAQEIEFRNIIIGDSYSKFFYKYCFSSLAIQLNFHSFNFFWSHDNTETYHLLTLDLQTYF